MSQEFRTGIGYDSHRMISGCRLVLGTVEIPHEKGLSGHSDADVILHALTDALLGAAGMGDIGERFPPSDPQWRGADSSVFLQQARELLEENGYRVVNVDVVVIIERPKILPYREQMRASIAQVLGISRDRVAVKAKTAEGLGAVGREEAVEAHAVATLCRETSPAG